MEWRLPLLVISTLCGLAFSATGMVNRSTPASYAACTRVCIQVVPQEQLPAEHAARALGGDHLGVLGSEDGALGLHGEHVALNVEVDVFSFHPWQVKLHNELGCATQM